MRSIFLLSAYVFVAACGSVPAYDRENLAKPTMNLEHEGQQTSFRAHVHDSREGATGGHGSTGAGCGCN